MPMYVAVVLFSDVTVAWYTMDWVRHLPSSGQVSLFLQLYKGVGLRHVACSVIWNYVVELSA